MKEPYRQEAPITEEKIQQLVYDQVILQSKVIEKKLNDLYLSGRLNSFENEVKISYIFKILSFVVLLVLPVITISYLYISVPATNKDECYIKYVNPISNNNQSYIVYSSNPKWYRNDEPLGASMTIEGTKQIIEYYHCKSVK